MGGSQTTEHRPLATATLTVDLAKIRQNARRVVEALDGVAVVGVTKVTAGSPEVARAMLAGGAAALGESRLENIERLRSAGVDAQMWLLRAPTPALAEQTVALADVSLVSEIETLLALEAACARLDRDHEVLVMVDLGDLREGLLPEDVPSFLARAEALAHVRVLGVGTSLTCYGAIVPDELNLGRLVELAKEGSAQLGRRLMISGGMSTTLDAYSCGTMPAEIDNLRVGEAIVLGVSPASRERILDLHTDAVTLAAPVIECKVKPSMPIGTSAQDAFGNRPSFPDRGMRRRAICALGRQDAPPTGLAPLTRGVEVLGASSDHLILDVEDMAQPPAIGEAIEFVPNYAATLALFTSPYVVKEYVGA